MAAFSVSAGSRHAGFTLIELMVVLLLIGIITSFAVLSIKRDPWNVELQRQLQRLTALVSAGSESAVLRSRELAILFDDDRYTFMILGNEDWEPITDDRLFRERELPDGISLRLTIEDHELQLVPTGRIDQEEREDQNRQRPMVLLLSSGEVTPFSVTLTAAETGAKYQRSWDIFGAIEQDRDEDH